MSGYWFPQVSFDGTNYLVVWQQLPSSGADQSLAHINGTRVTPAGVVLDGSGIAVDAGGTQRRAYQSIAYTGSDYLIAWSDYAYANAGSVGVRLTRLTPAGSITTPAGGLVISGAPTSQPAGIYAYTSVAAGAKTAAVTFINSYGTGTLLGTLGYGL